MGLIVTLSDPEAKKQGDDSQQALGNLLAFAGAGFGAIVGLLSQKNSQVFHPIVYLAHLYFFYVVIQLSAFPFFQDNPVFYSLDPEYGAFGWMTNFKTFIYLEAVIVPMTNILGSIGFLKCYEYWPMEIVSIVLLFQPFVTQTIAVILGQDEIPGFHTLLGIIIISFGLLLASFGAKSKSMKIHVENGPDSKTREE